MNPIENNQPLRILIIEDNSDIAANIADYLEGRGHILDFAYDGIGGLHLALTKEYDIIVLDLLLPGMDGITLCRKLREETEKNIPVLMLTARDTLPDKIEGFDAGADDYLVKPFALEELYARLKALVKRSHPQKSQTLLLHDLEINIGTMVVKREGQIIELNKTCLKILIKLMKSYPNIVTRSELETYLWGDMPPGSDALRSHIYLLRKKIDRKFSYPLIQTIRDMGYRIGKPDEILP